MNNFKIPYTKILDLICTTGTIALLLPGCVFTVHAAPEETAYTEEPLPYTEAFGNVDLPDPVYSIYEADSALAVGFTELPTSYDSRNYGYITPVKFQAPWENCWSFSTLSALESSMLSTGLASSADLSEYHLNYYVYKNTADPLGGTKGDKVDFNGTFRDFLLSGGNAQVAYHALANWMGAVPESVTGYPTGNPAALADTIESAYLQDTVHLQQAYRINSRDMDAVKQEIIQYGAVTTGFFYDRSFFNPASGAYCTNLSRSTNHGAVIVGWDDDYSRDNFSIKPSGNGAWLVKNSWGTSFGLEGYLWLSYEDASIEDAACVLIGESADNYDYNYQYDGTYLNNYIVYSGNILTANVFHVPEDHGQEELQAVSFELGSPNVYYSIQIYTNLTDPSRPDSGIPRLSEPLTGMTRYQGYYTVELPESVALNPGESFAVVAEYNKNDNIRPALERSGVWNNTTFTASAKAGQSFLSTNSGKSWLDAGTYYGGNLRIKAFTSKTDVPSRFLSLNPSKTDLTIGEKLSLTVLLNGEEQPLNDNSRYNWNVDQDGIVSIGTDGVISGLSAGTCTVTCSNRENPQEKASATITIRTNFEDIRTTEWHYPFVLNVYNKGLMVGNGANLFGTEASLTRSEFVTILYACAGRPEYAYRDIFSDVTENDWYSVPVIWAYDMGITVGYGDAFGVSDSITREQMISMLYKYGISTKKDMSFNSDILQGYEDISDISNYAVEPIKWAVSHNMLAGRGSMIAPQGDTTRAECAAIITRLLEWRDG